jgi:hypothetical protein
VSPRTSPKKGERKLRARNKLDSFYPSLSFCFGLRSDSRIFYNLCTVLGSR